MAPSRDEIETRIESLAQEVADLRRRIHVLEAHEAAATAGEVSTDDEQSLAFADPSKWAAADIVGLAGRTLVVLGGAFLLRAVSAAALLPDISGPILGLAYAAWWLRQADRTEAPDQRNSAFFHAVSGIGIAYPLIWEASVRFHLLPGLIAGPAVVLFLALALTVAWRRCLRVLAWIALGAALGTTLGLFFSSREFVLYTGTLLTVAVVVESFGFRDRWPELRWAPAFVLDVVLALLAVLVSQPRLSPEFAQALPPSGVIAVSLLTPVIYLSSVASATLVQRRAITLFELLQVGASLLCGIGTALTVIAFQEGDPSPIGIAITIIGMTCYGVAFRSIDAEAHPRINFYAYTSFAGVLVVVGSALLLDWTTLAIAWSALAWIGISLGVRYERNTLRLHAALYLAAASICSGLASIGLQGLLGPAADLRPGLTTPACVVAAGSAAAYLLLAAKSDTSDPAWTDHAPRAILAAVVTWSIAGLCAPWLTSLVLASWAGLDANAFLASMRTSVLSTLAVALAWAGRRWSLPDLVWLVYPLMAATGARLLWEDLSYGGPVNLFLALGFYGGALIVTSQLLRQES